MAAEGKIQSEIARALEVSVMTLHRWRKSPPLLASETPSYTVSAGDRRELRIAQLQSENTRLRRMVTDLLLETMQLQEAAEQIPTDLDDRKRIAQ
jgi:putative transposase